MTDQDRAEFEAWLDECDMPHHTHPDYKDVYHDPDVNMMRDAWLAARRTQSQQVRELVETWIGMKDTRRACVYLNAPEIAEAINTLAARLKETQDD